MRTTTAIARLALDPALLEAISGRICSTHSLESAGLCYGQVDRSCAWVTSVRWAETVYRDSFSVRSDARRHGEPVVCVLHSHPSGALSPSLADIRGMDTTRLPWLFAVVRNGRARFRAYRCRRNVVHLVPVSVGELRGVPNNKPNQS
jgi:proteasome lid subunit RPN8/RPN11